jgi:hypothetical protein
MKACDVCGNHYEHSFEVRHGDHTYTFDSLECAVHRLAPRCAHCNCRILGHGIEAEGRCFCCAHCAREGGIEEARDNVTATPPA